MDPRAEKIIAKYGKDRVVAVWRYVDKLHRYYNFLPKDRVNDTAYDFAEDLASFTLDDLAESLKILAKRNPKKRLEFSEIYGACCTARDVRERITQMKLPVDERKPAPPNIKAMLEKIVR